MYQPPLNAHAHSNCRARGLKFWLSFHLHPYFVYESSKGSEPLLLDNAKVPKSHVLAGHHVQMI